MRTRAQRPSTILLASLSMLLAALVGGCAGSDAGSERALLSRGTTLPEAVLEDQFGDAHSIDGSLKMILLSRDMEGGRVVREVLEADPEVLQRQGAVYIADISGMPRVIASLMAIPKMRERPYPTLLDRDGSVTANYPYQAGKATRLILEGLRIERVEYIGSVEEMALALDIQLPE